jgi:hypothetical protein
VTGDETPPGATTEGTAERDAATEPPPEAPDTPAAPADLGDEAGSVGAAPTPGTAAADDYGDPDARAGDFTDPDVDLTHLTPTDDGDPDDDPDPRETVEQDATGQAVIAGEQDPAPDDVPAGQPGEHEEPTA